jgi:hypothetical protein
MLNKNQLTMELNFKVNKNVREERVISEIERALVEISDNATNGIAITEVEFESDIFFEVRRRLRNKLTSLGVATKILTLQGNLASIRNGNTRYSKIKIVD